MSIEIMKQALEAFALLDALWYQSANMNPRVVERKMYAAKDALRQAIANEALDKKAENARELGLDYEPVQAEKPFYKVEGPLHVVCQCDKCKTEKQEPVAWMYPDDLERFETSETFAQAYSIEMVSPTQGETVPLYTTPQPQQAQKQEPWVWQQSPIKTQWGDDMVVADLAIDKDHTVSVYCEKDQTARVEAMFKGKTT